MKIFEFPPLLGLAGYSYSIASLWKYFKEKRGLKEMWYFLHSLRKFSLQETIFPTPKFLRLKNSRCWRISLKITSKYGRSFPEINWKIHHFLPAALGMESLGLWRFPLSEENSASILKHILIDNDAKRALGVNINFAEPPNPDNKLQFSEDSQKRYKSAGTFNLILILISLVLVGRSWRIRAIRFKSSWTDSLAKKRSPHSWDSIWIRTLSDKSN